MDGESNTDSDISESWCMFDSSDVGNENDAGGSGGVNPSGDTEIPERLANGNHSGEREDGDKVGGNKEYGTGEESNATSPDVPSEDLDFQVLYKDDDAFRDDCDSKGKSSDFDCTKTGFTDTEKAVDRTFKDINNDSDSVSVISEDECNELGCGAYENVEVLDGKSIQGESHCNPFNRKNRKLNCKESSDENLTSDFMFPGGPFPTHVPSDNVEKSTNEARIKYVPSVPVYRHYRNNMANTILSMAMGIMFAGVACIALGHFLGVHDAQDTVGQMMENLKKLQMENVILQSRMSQLSQDVQDAQHTSGEMLETLGRIQMKNMVLQSRMNEAMNLVCEVKESGTVEVEHQVEAPEEKREKGLKEKDVWESGSESIGNKCCYVRKLGDWYTKRAKARERFRYDAKMRNWQFKRTKKQEEFHKREEYWQIKRNKGQGKMQGKRWQLKRAVGRKSSRNNVYSQSKKKSKYFRRRGYFSRSSS